MTRARALRRVGARSALAGLLGVWALWPSAAAAQSPPEASVATARFTRGNQLFAQRAFAAAVVEFRAAHELSGRPELLFNLGRALEEDGRLRDALDAYRRFDQAMPSGFDRTTVRAQITGVEARLAAARAGEGHPAAARTPLEARGVAVGVATPHPVRTTPAGGLGPPSPLSLGLMIGGGVALAGGVVFGLLERASLSGCEVQGEVARCDDQAALDRARRSPGMATAANVSFAVGAAAVASGVVVWVITPSRSTRVALGPGTVSLTARW